MVMAEKMIWVIVLVPKISQAVASFYYTEQIFEEWYNVAIIFLEFFFRFSGRSRILYEETLSGTVDGRIMPPVVKFTLQCVSVVGFSGNLAMK